MTTKEERKTKTKKTPQLDYMSQGSGTGCGLCCKRFPPRGEGVVGSRQRGGTPTRNARPKDAKGKKKTRPLPGPTHQPGLQTTIPTRPPFSPPPEGGRKRKSSYGGVFPPPQKIHFPSSPKPKFLYQPKKIGGECPHPRSKKEKKVGCTSRPSRGSVD